MGLANVAIIGLGFIGGSLAKAMKEAGLKGSIMGISRNPENLSKAKTSGIIDHYSTSSAEGIQGADLIILATNVSLFEDIVKRIRKNFKKGAIVSDVGSVKGNLVVRLESLMPEGVHFVGAHPIAGGECSGLDAVDALLFKGNECIITPTKETNKDALEEIIHLWKAVGSIPVLMDCHEHDRFFSALSHLPHIAAYALVNGIANYDNKMFIHAGRGFKDMTRIALSPAEMWKDICMNNKENIIEMINYFESSLSSLKEKILYSDWIGLIEEFERARAFRSTIESSSVKS